MPCLLHAPAPRQVLGTARTCDHLTKDYRFGLDIRLLDGSASAIIVAKSLRGVYSWGGDPFLRIEVHNNLIVRMPNPDVDRYIADAPPYARPYLTRIRGLFHQADPEIGETIKWNAPHFMCEGIVGSMAAFKEHVRLIFWRGKRLPDPDGILQPFGSRSEMAGLNIQSGEKLPPDDILIACIREAVELNRKGERDSRQVDPVPAPDVPEDFRIALDQRPMARSVFDGFSAYNQREYVDWIEEAKRETTRLKRIEQAVAWISEGKPRNWKYMKDWK